jgi:hypothetical protein
LHVVEFLLISILLIPFFSPSILPSHSLGTTNEHLKHLKGAAKVDFLTCDYKRISVWKQLLGSSSRKSDRSLVSYVKGTIG